MLKRYFIAGLFFWLPLVFTFFVIKFFINTFDQLYYAVPSQYRFGGVLENYIPGVGVLVFLLLTWLTGFFITNILGSKLVKVWENLIKKIPILGNIYSSARQIVGAFSENTKHFKQVVLIEYPKKGLYTLAFQTNEFILDDQTNYLSVFIPTTPNPTSGFLIMTKKEKLVYLNISIEEAFKIIISGGIVINQAQWKDIYQNCVNITS